MIESFENAIDAVYEKNPAAFQDAMGNILQDKLRERIGVEKVVVSQSFLDEPQVDEYEEEEVADEDV